MTIFEATERVSGIAEKKFGCKVVFHYSPVLSHMADFQDINTEAQHIFEVLERNIGAKFILSKGAILVPIYIEKEIFGCIEIKNGDILDPDIYEDLHTLLDSTLRDFIVKKELLRRLKIQEALLRNQQSNVVPIFKPRTSDEGKNVFSLISHNDEPLKQALFIHGQDYSKMRDLAVDVHSLMSRNSFVPYSVLDFKRNFFDEMCELGRISIFIPEILDLSEIEIQDITNYLIKNISPSCPFLIVSSQKTLSVLEHEALIPDNLIKILKRFHLEVSEDTKKSKPAPLWEESSTTDIH